MLFQNFYFTNSTIYILFVSDFLLYNLSYWLPIVLMFILNIVLVFYLGYVSINDRHARKLKLKKLLRMLERQDSILRRCEERKFYRSVAFLILIMVFCESLNLTIYYLSVFGKKTYNDLLVASMTQDSLGILCLVLFFKTYKKCNTFNIVNRKDSDTAPNMNQETTTLQSQENEIVPTNNLYPSLILA